MKVNDIFKKLNIEDIKVVVEGTVDDKTTVSLATAVHSKSKLNKELVIECYNLKNGAEIYNIYQI